MRSTDGPPPDPGQLWVAYCARTRRPLKQAQYYFHLKRQKFKQATLRARFQAAHDFDTGLLSAAEHLAAEETYDLRMREAKQRDHDRQFDWHANENERSSRFFFRRCLHLSPAAIHAAFNDHWRTIMAPAAPPPINAAAQTHLLGLITERLSDHDRTALDAPFTTPELADAIRGMSPNKSPGLDGRTNNGLENFEALCLVLSLQLRLEAACFSLDDVAMNQ
ncbi:hypothetical protein H310_07833 [Aphanomyces invadans]|uniref:Reverse transcriptase domain-containing protein n=1 Tax=Aphanomyces invadans TaxID=157072 RepID=A0A024U0N3_9STRA|nr:hypothetical protein H310_07833 [Aphanomyces invadans]ETV99789.1 hypothetical protein H310_07833 [Aphanomyces invadans]|eukprot:XP_008871565.1 hypothetical protein H310_07833 [Aphanomyces invadans]